MILAIAALRNLEVHQMDVKTAFLNGDLEEEIYMDFEICTIEENGQIVNTLFIPQGSGLIISSTNGKAGLSDPDASLIGDYTNEDSDIIMYSLLKHNKISRSGVFF